MQSAIFYRVPDEMILYIDVLGACVILRVLSKCNGALAVGVDGVLIADIVTEFF